MLLQPHWRTLKDLNIQDSSQKPAEKTSEQQQAESIARQRNEALLRVHRCALNAFYGILGLQDVRSTVTELKIKKAYHKLSLLIHPDKNEHEYVEAAFKMINSVFEVLGDKVKRAKYDENYSARRWADSGVSIINHTGTCHGFSRFASSCLFSSFG